MYNIGNQINMISFYLHYRQVFLITLLLNLTLQYEYLNLSKKKKEKEKALTIHFCLVYLVRLLIQEYHTVY